MIGLARWHRDGHRLVRAGPGDNEYSAGLVAFNAIFQMLLLRIFSLTSLSPSCRAVRIEGRKWLHITIWQIAQSVLITWGIPFLAG